MNDLHIWRAHKWNTLFLYAKKLMRKLIWLFDVTILKTVIVVWGETQEFVICLLLRKQWLDWYFREILPIVPISWHVSPPSVIRTHCFLFSELDSGCVAMGLCNACLPTLCWPCTSTTLAQLLCNIYPEGGVASGEAPKGECVHTLGWRPWRSCPNEENKQIIFQSNQWPQMGLNEDNR